MVVNHRRVLVTGGGTFLGDNIAAALLAEGAEVTLLVRPGNEDRLGPLAQRVRWWAADMWDTASLRGRARGHGAVIHTVGSMIADPAKGLTLHRLNFVSARNAVTMCISDGVPHMMLMSSARAPWVSSGYIRAKREAEDYLTRVGVKGTIIRAPLAYMRGRQRPLFYELVTLLAGNPPLAWTPLSRLAPIPVDVLARSVARLALSTERDRKIYYARDLRRIGGKGDLSAPITGAPDDTQPTRSRLHPFELLDDETPFGWTPPSDKDKR